MSDSVRSGEYVKPVGGAGTSGGRKMTKWLQRKKREAEGRAKTANRKDPKNANKMQNNATNKGKKHPSEKEMQNNAAYKEQGVKDKKRLFKIGQTFYPATSAPVTTFLFKEKTQE